MSFLFFGVATVMLIVAIGFVAVPLRAGKSKLVMPQFLIVAFISLSAVGLYALLGSHDNVAIQHSTADNVPSSTADRPLGTVDSMVDGLVARLEIAPDDADGWILLARSYEYLDRDSAALDAYEHARALGKTDSNLEASLLGDGPSGEIVNDASGMSLRGRVALSSAATSEVQPGDTLFIFAKTSRDDRMPVVALRRHASELPYEFVLTDNEIMVQGRQLSDYKQLLVMARISRTGNASDNTLGLEAWSDMISPANGSRIELLIGGQDE